MGLHSHRKYSALAYKSHSGDASTSKPSRKSDLQVPESNTSAQLPQVVVRSPSSSGSENNVNSRSDSTLVTRGPRHVSSSSVAPRDYLGNIDRLLLKEDHHHIAKGGKKFWSPPILEKIVTFPNVLAALKRCGILDNEAKELAKTVLQPPIGQRPSYIKVFGILELCDKTSSIRDFLSTENGVCDEDLPLLSVNTDDGMQLRKVGKEGGLACFNNWRPGYLDRFKTHQYEFSPHIFRTIDTTSAPHFQLGPEVILPFTCPNDMQDSSQTDERIGASGEVFKYCIPPGCHGFDEILKKASRDCERFQFLMVILP